MSRSSFQSAHKGKVWPRRECPSCRKSVPWMTSGYDGRSDYRSHKCPHGKRCPGRMNHERCDECDNNRSV